MPPYPPARPSHLEDHLKRIAAILRNAQARLLITVERIEGRQHRHLRFLVAAVPRHGADWGFSWRPVLGLSFGPDVADGILARPARWLETIHRHRGTVSAAPNFAYELCLAKVTDAELATLDRSCWRLAFDGAEPVSPNTLERFAARFAPCSLQRAGLMPVYGLAENTVGLSFGPVGRGPQEFEAETRHQQRSQTERGKLQVNVLGHILQHQGIVRERAHRTTPMQCLPDRHGTLQARWRKRELITDVLHDREKWCDA